MAGPTPSTGRAGRTTGRATQRRSAPSSAAAAPTVGEGITAMIPATVVATPAAPVVHTPRDYMPAVYGMIVLLVGFGAVLLALWLVVINSNQGAGKGLTDPAGLLGMVAIAIAGLGGAFFGGALGLQSTLNANKERAAAEAAKDAVQARAERYLAYLDPEVARNLVQ